MSRKTIKQLLKKHSGLLARYGVERLALFGSYARDEATSKSDIDILVEFKKPTYSNLVNLARDLESVFHKKVDLITFAALDKRLKPFILKEAYYLERS